MQTPLGLFVLASGWFKQILLALFVLCYIQWVACAVSFSFISCTCSASGWFTQFLFLFLFFPLSTARFGQRLA